MTALTITVRGLPAPQGSKRHLGRGILVESSAKVRPWRNAVAFAAADTYRAAGITEPLDGPLAVSVVFVLPRPKGHFGTGRNATAIRESAPMAPHKLPDLDKLVRSTFDGLTESGLWNDDAQIVDLTARKAYPGAGSAGLLVPGAVIQVTTLTAGAVVAPLARAAR